MSGKAGAVSVRIEGKTYAGDYAVNGRMIHVVSPYGEARKPLGVVSPKVLAGMALGEIVRTHRAREKRAAAAAAKA